MAPSRALRPLAGVCKSCTRHQTIIRRQFSDARSLRFDDVRSESRLPRVATPSFWSSLIPKAFRRSSEPAEASEQATSTAAKSPRKWNPYTTFILLAILVGSNAIQLIALRNDTANFSRKTDAKLELLREVVQKVKNGEDVDVRRALGTGDPQAEREWEEVVREVTETDVLLEGKKKHEAKRAAKAKESRLREEQERQTASPVAVDERNAGVREGRPKFLM